MHTLLRIEEQLCAKWTDEEVLKRAKALHPMAYRAAEDEKRLDAHAALYRERLTSLSWFMRELNMSIAKRANKEDKVTGRFWEGRFKSKPCSTKAPSSRAWRTWISTPSTPASPRA